MSYVQQIKNTLQLQERIFLICFSLVFMGCQQTEKVERNVLFDNEWKMVSNENQSNEQTTLRKEFYVDKLSDKLYYMELCSQGNITVQLNKADIPGTKTDGNILLYNLTDHLKNQNIIDIKSSKNFIRLDEGKTDLNIWMHCVNKLFIPEIRMDLNTELNESNALVVEVKVKNAFEMEKQGVLVYNFYLGKNQKFQTKETPVFISGNAENIYRQELNLNNSKVDNQELRIECQLYSDEILFDSNSEIFTLNKESLLTRNEQK